MSIFDIKYAEIVNNIIDNGMWDKDQNVRTKWADGTPAYTKSIICQQIQLNNGEKHEVPILTTKKVAWKTAIHEILQFYKERTSNHEYLRKNNVKIWDEWTRTDGTIGRAYGYQLGKPIRTGKWKTNPISGFTTPIYTNQVHKLIDGIKNDPASRRHIITLMNIDDAWDMALQPCVWHSQWLVKEGKLHLIVGIRSNDMALGNPFNVFQYYVLQRMVAQVTGYEVGSITFNINDAHVYERHIEPIQEQMQREGFEAPELWINPEIKNFDDFTIDDFKLIGYEFHPSIKMEVAI
ncbi:Thymidylate synthase 1 [compost metagenome]